MARNGPDWRLIARDRLRSLLVGERRGMTRCSLLLGVAFAVGLAALEYAYLPPGLDVEPISGVLRVFELEPNLSAALAYELYGAFVAVALAGSHAYLNEGYLPSVALAAAPAYGSHLWTIALPGERLSLDPLAAFERTFPEVLAFATVGFLVGLSLRWLGARLREGRGPAATR